MVEDSIYVHNIFGFILLAIVIFQLSIINSAKAFVRRAKTYRFILPTFYVLFTMLVFTGVIVMAVKQFSDISSKEAIMIIVSLVIFILEIKVYKKLRVITSQDVEAQKALRVFANKVLGTILALLLFTIVVSFL